MIGDNVFNEQLNRTFAGVGSPEACIRLIDKVIEKVKSDDCHPKPCAIGDFYQPSIDPNKTYYAVGAYHHTVIPIGAVTSDGIYVPRTGLEKAKEFCVKVSITQSFNPLTPSGATWVQL